MCKKIEMMVNKYDKLIEENNGIIHRYTKSILWNRSEWDSMSITDSKMDQFVFNQQI